MEEKLKKAVKYLLFDVNNAKDGEEQKLKDNLKIVKESGYSLVEAFNLYQKEVHDIEIKSRFNHLDEPIVK